MEHLCPFCNKIYANKRSLASHKSQFHKTMNKTSNNTSEDNIPTYREKISRKRTYSSEESEDENEAIVERKKSKYSNNETISKLTRVVAKLIKEVNQIHTTFGEVAKDIDKAEDKIDENKRNISREITFKDMNGGGIDIEMKRFYHKIMDENPNLIKDVKETKKTVDAIQQHKFFKEDLKEDDKIKKNIMEMEECFINAMEIRQLFNDHDIDNIKFKIKELQNAAQVAKAILELSEIENLMLKTIIYSSKIQVMGFLDEWFIYLRLIFDRLPSDDDLKDVAKNFTKEYKLAKEEELKNESGEDTDGQTSESSESDSEDADDEASEKSESDNGDNHVNEESVNDADDNSKTIYKVDEDSQTENDDKSVTSKDESETSKDESETYDVGDEVSDQDGTE